MTARRSPLLPPSRLGPAQGGGLLAGSGSVVEVVGSAIEGNTARRRGSIAVGGGVVTVGNVTTRDGSTISHNTAVSASGLAHGGGLFRFRLGGRGGR